MVSLFCALTVCIVPKAKFSGYSIVEDVFKASHSGGPVMPWIQWTRFWQRIGTRFGIVTLWHYWTLRLFSDTSWPTKLKLSITTKKWTWWLSAELANSMLLRRRLTSVHCLPQDSLILAVNSVRVTLTVSLAVVNEVTISHSLWIAYKRKQMNSCRWWIVLPLKQMPLLTTSHGIFYNIWLS